jgi:hypothetical protein
MLRRRVSHGYFGDCDQLTGGALGLITTLGGSWPWRPGVPGPPPGLCAPPNGPNLSGVANEF